MTNPVPAPAGEPGSPLANAQAMHAAACAVEAASNAVRTAASALEEMAAVLRREIRERTGSGFGATP